MKKSIAFLLIAVVIAITALSVQSRIVEDSDPLLGTQYSLRIVDEHEVVCTTAKGDTIKLFFENATVLAEETIVFIKH